MIATAQDIVSLGFDADLLNQSDEIPEGDDASPLTLYVQKAIRRAATRLARWVSQERYDEIEAREADDPLREAYLHAEALLAIAELLPVVYARNIASEEQVEIEGLRLRFRNLSKDEQAFQLSQLITQAEAHVITELVNGSVSTGEGFVVL
ncbi:MAG: hypothetical protein KDK41_11925 [Leptospiraceae bacterium]|nr:hypothetical protein [Leptospiraceae bacterium]